MAATLTTIKRDIKLQQKVLKTAIQRAVRARDEKTLRKLDEKLIEMSETLSDYAETFAEMREIIFDSIDN